MIQVGEPPVRARPVALRVRVEEGHVVADVPQERERRVVVGVGLPAEARDDVGGQSGARHALADVVDEVQKDGLAVLPPHGLVEKYSSLLQSLI